MRNHGSILVHAMGAAVVLFALAVPVAAQTPTAEQVQAFQDLTPEQQQAVLRQVGTQGAGQTTAGGDANRSVDAKQPVESPTRRDSATQSPLSMALSPDDLVLVELAMPGTMSKGNVRNSQMEDPSADTAPRRLRAATTTLDVETEQRLKDIIAVVQSRNPYRLDQNGQLILPGFAPILLGGLNDQQAVQRLSVEPTLLQLDVSLQRLPVNKIGIAGLQPYGYRLFEDAQSGFGPTSDAPVPADYIVGTGDELVVQLFGSQSRTYRLRVAREGTISFPELGPIQVGGLRFSEVRTAIEARVARQIIGVRANVSMGDTRAINVLVLGEVRQPGNHAVNGLATMTTALFASGGVSSIGSLRDVQLKRQGEVVRRLDLYALLIDGNTADDAKLQAGDVIFVPPVGPTVSVEGEVKRPAIYELRGQTTAAQLLQMAGGLNREADPVQSSITRVDEQFRRVVLDIDFTSSAASGLPLRNGDALMVARLRPQIDSGVVLEGFVYRPGVKAWRPGLRLTDVIGSMDELKANADAHYVLIRRESGADRHVQALSADLVGALAQRGGAADPQLQARDRITVFDLAPGRERIIKPLLDEIRLQSGLSRPTEVVSIGGKVKVPGDYPLEPGMTLTGLLRAGGNLEAAAFGGKAELMRRELDGSGARQAALIEVDLAALLRGDPQADIALRPFDHLLIKEAPNWTDQESVTLRGEVMFPGTYPILGGETLYDVLKRAGGLTPRAFARGSAFTREYLRQNERQLKEKQAERLQGDLLAMSLRSAAANQAGAGQTLATGQSVLEQLKAATPVGRMVIDLPGLLAGGKGSAKDIALRDGDLLVVPQARQEVTVIGEVQNTASHLYSAELRRDDYIALSGDVTRQADKQRIYVVRADGTVVTQRGGMLGRKSGAEIEPGDTIVVPLDTERLPRLPFWQAVTQIIYNLAISVAAVNSF